MRGSARFQYTPSQTPLVLDATLRSYLQREFEAIRRQMSTLVSPETLYAAIEEQILLKAVTPAYLEVSASGLPLAVPNIGAAWQRVTQLDFLPFPPKFMSWNPVNHSVTIEEKGIFSTNITFIIDHNVSSSVGREFGMRFFNLTKNEAGESLRIYTGRGQEGTQVAASVGRALLSDAWIGDEIVLEYGGTTDVYTNVVMQVASIFVFSVSEKIP